MLVFSKNCISFIVVCKRIFNNLNRVTNWFSYDSGNKERTSTHRFA